MRCAPSPMTTPSSFRGSRGLFACSALLALCLALPAQADDELASGTPRFIAALSSGLPLRLTLADDLAQQRLAPAFVDGLFGYALSSSWRYQHGVGLGVSSNVQDDGGYTEPVHAGEQLVLMPAYLGYLPLSADAPLLLHLGLPVLLGPAGRSFGLEAGAALGYRLLAGASVFCELDLSTYVGARATLHALASLELGVLLEYEVLP